MNIINIKEYFNQEMENLQSLSTNPDFEVPSLLIIDATGGDAANQIYIKKKEEDFEKLHWHCYVKKVSSTYQLRKVINYAIELGLYNNIIVQLPTAAGIEFDPKWIPTFMDTDGLNPASTIVPATARGVVDYLDDCEFPFSGNSAVVVGRSNIVGRPVARELLNRDMTVSVCHSRTPESTRDDLLAHADLVVVATGKPHLIRREDCPNAFVVDVGINRMENGRLCGDFLEEPKIVQSAAFGEGIRPSTPVPGGVGLLTRLGLLRNCVELASLSKRC